jgi:hypothetical protein
MKYITRDNGQEAIADDMAPTVRAVALLIEHANRRRDNRLPLPCCCGECERYRRHMRCTVLEDGTLAIEAR